MRLVDAGRGLVVHDAHRLDARAPCPRASRASIAAGSAPWRQSPAMNSGARPSFVAIFCHSVAKWPVSNISTLSPGESVLTSAASHAPVPEAGIDHHRLLRLEDAASARRAPPCPSCAELRARGGRWSAWSIARSTRSGTLVGPGICRKWRPAAYGPWLHSSDCMQSRCTIVRNSRGYGLRLADNFVFCIQQCDDPQEPAPIVRRPLHEEAT